VILNNREENRTATVSFPRKQESSDITRVLMAAVVISSFFLFPCDASAVVVFVKNSDDPIIGYLVSESDTQIEINSVLSDGRIRKRVIRRSDIEDIVITVAKEKLSALSPDNAQGYRNYADQLARSKQDPEARDAAMRLYLIAIHLDPATHARSSFLALIKLARTPLEERQFRALAFLFDSAADPSLLRAAKQKALPASNAEARQQLLSAIRLLRRGKSSDARRFLTLPAVRAELSQHETVFTLAEFQTAASQAILSQDNLRKIISLELILDQSNDAPEPSAEPVLGSSWGDNVLGDGVRPLTPLKLETVTEFDPRESKYTDGEWSVP